MHQIRNNPHMEQWMEANGYEYHKLFGTYMLTQDIEEPEAHYLILYSGVEDHHHRISIIRLDDRDYRYLMNFPT